MLEVIECGALSDIQEQAARQHRRQMSKDAALKGADKGGSGGFTGPDQSGQWVSVGELHPGESLEEALSGLSTGVRSVLVDRVSLYFVLHLCHDLHACRPSLMHHSICCIAVIIHALHHNSMSTMHPLTRVPRA